MILKCNKCGVIDESGLTPRTASYDCDPHIWEEIGARLPIDMILLCPVCNCPHVDKPEPDKGWENPPHRSHLCHDCGTVWRPADVPTNGVAQIKTKGEKDTWRSTFS